ncbi:DUF2393 family protein [Campylobacter sp. faydin G-24]|uniref:DUF2393 family protein n=1 Tax=Campylobacter anatolicus TaxID=2829105 RepID=A0ABS5HG47_9BACT|nr:DUF2393 family protein [Campylobacter anatolicus]MBR8462363.1 DUF2393 family protein [Campylobacter anatolicus]MBR8463185.1 DUF2393 family protein [Campylobacter anatolicus]MBR8465497.1 DUF2393 family protein [Campylobacter anatolicus]
MSANYFTIVHIIVIFIIVLLSILFFILSLKAEKKLFLSLLLTNILVSTTLCIFLMLVLDKYTKKGVLENVTSERILRNESITFRGNVRNVGKFMISQCTLEVKLVNQVLGKDNMDGESFFKPSGMSFFSWFKKDDANARPNTVEQKFIIVRDLPRNKSINFSVNMPYPPYFKKGMNITKLYCH